MENIFSPAKQDNSSRESGFHNEINLFEALEFDTESSDNQRIANASIEELTNFIVDDMMKEVKKDLKKKINRK